LVSRSVRAVSSVDAASVVGPTTATQVWPGASPYGFPVGPDAPVSLIPHVVFRSSRLVFARRAAYGSLADRIPGWLSKSIPRNSSRAVFV